MYRVRDRIEGVTAALANGSCGGWTAAAIGVVVVFAALNLRLVIGLDAAIWDADRQFAPGYGLVADHARVGRILLWNPWIAGGYPEGVDPQIGAFSPLTVAFGFLTGGRESGFRLYWLGIWLFGGLGMLQLARHLRAPPWGGFVVAMGLLYCGFYTGHAEHTAWIYSFSFIPWVLWRLDVGLSTGRFRPVVEAGALWGLSALAGYPAYVLYGFMFCGLWGVGRWMTAHPPRRAMFARLIVHGAVATTIGLIVLSPALVAYVTESDGFSERAGPLPREVAVGDNALDPGAIVTVVSPYPSVLELWNPGRWPGTDISHTSMYVGTLVLVMALGGLLGSRDRFRWWLALVGLAFVLASLEGSPLRGWLYDLLPPMRYARHSSQLKDIALLIATIIAALGSRDIDRRWRPSRVSVALTVAMGCIAIAVLSLDLARLADPGPHPVIAFAHLLGIWGGVIAAGALSVRWPDRMSRCWPLALVVLSIADAGATALLSRPVMVDRGQVRARWDSLNANHVSGLDLAELGWSREMETAGSVVGSPANWNVPLRRQTLTGYVTLTSRLMDELISDEALAAPALGRRRVWFAARAAEVALEPGMASAVTAATADGLPRLIVRHAARQRTTGETLRPIDLDQELKALPPIAPIDWKLFRYQPNELVFEVNAPSAGWLLITDRWAHGWKAWVSGRETEIWQGHLVFRALRVSAGPHLVEMRFRPGGYPWLILLSWTMLAGVALAALVVSLKAPQRCLHLIAGIDPEP